MYKVVKRWNFLKRKEFFKGINTIKYITSVTFMNANSGELNLISFLCSRNKKKSGRNDPPLKSGQNDPPLILARRDSTQLDRNNSSRKSGRNDLTETIQIRSDVLGYKKKICSDNTH